MPNNLDEYLTPLSLATWYMDNISNYFSKSGLSSFNLNEKDINYISNILKDKYNLETIIKLPRAPLGGWGLAGGRPSGEKKDKVSFYIKNTSNDRFSNLIKPYLLPSLQYKLNSTCNKLTLLNNSNTSLRGRRPVIYLAAEYLYRLRVAGGRESIQLTLNIPIIIKKNMN